MRAFAYMANDPSLGAANPAGNLTGDAPETRLQVASGKQGRKNTLPGEIVQNALEARGFENHMIANQLLAAIGNGRRAPSGSKLSQFRAIWSCEVYGCAGRVTGFVSKRELSTPGGQRRFARRTRDQRRSAIFSGNRMRASLGRPPIRIREISVVAPRRNWFEGRRGERALDGTQLKEKIPDPSRSIRNKFVEPGPDDR